MRKKELKYDLLKKNNETLKSENETLKSDISRLRLDNERLNFQLEAKYRNYKNVVSIELLQSLQDKIKESNYGESHLFSTTQVREMIFSIKGDS